VINKIFATCVKWGVTNISWIEWKIWQKYVRIRWDYEYVRSLLRHSGVGWNGNIKGAFGIAIS
jgi:hypothetical protein